jgi:hypothetical protein
MQAPQLNEAYVCGCRRSFTGPGPLKYHQRTCPAGRKRLHGALLKAKELWDGRKKPRNTAIPEEPEPSHHVEDQVGLSGEIGDTSPDIVRDSAFAAFSSY